MNGITTIVRQTVSESSHSWFITTNQIANLIKITKVFIRTKAHGVFNGKVFVEKLLKKPMLINKQQYFIDEGATMTPKPQLEIFADDVKCSHGCTVGQLNEDALSILEQEEFLKKKLKPCLTICFR